MAICRVEGQGEVHASLLETFEEFLVHYLDNASLKSQRSWSLTQNYFQPRNLLQNAGTVLQLLQYFVKFTLLLLVLCSLFRLLGVTTKTSMFALTSSVVAVNIDRMIS